MGPIPGLPGQIWTQFLAALSYFETNLDTENPQNSLSLITGMSQTCLNALDGLTAYSYYTAAQNAYTLISPVLTYNLGIDSIDLSAITGRINAIQSMVSALDSYLVIPMAPNISVIANGQSAITAQSMLNFWMSFDDEVPPSGFSYVTFFLFSEIAMNAWGLVSNAINTSPIQNKGNVYDACLNMLNASSVTYDEIYTLFNDGGGVSQSNPTNSWNSMVALPSILRFLATYINDPSSRTAQQISIIRLVILNTLPQLNSLALSIRTQLSSQINVATLPMGQTLMDLSAKQLGDYEQWTNIASINQLNPPYIGTGPNLAAPGSRLFTSAPTTSAGTPVSPPNYQINYLGIDLYYGPLNQDMLPWTGDFQTISGYQNLSFSLGRRLQTTEGSLMYDLTYGSRIPPEVGSIQSQDTAGHIASYASSAILADPRVDKIASASVVLNPDGSINYSGTVIPNGSGGLGTNVNEVLQPL